MSRVFLPMRLLVLAVAALLSVATSAPRYTWPRDYPTWRLEGTDQVWVSKSGKAGFGISATRKDIVSARFETSALQVDGLAPIHDTTTSIYIGFVFDNERLWNSGVHTGRLILTFVDGSRATFAMKHVRDRPHKKLDRYQRQPESAPRRGDKEPMPMVPR